jgi:hypothetical protein
LGLAFAADALSIRMEIVDNAIIVLIPGAMDAAITTALFWGSLGLTRRGRRCDLSGQPLAHRTGARARGHPRAPLKFRVS